MIPYKITILGLLSHDPTLFDIFKIPTGVSRETLVNNLCLECGEFEVLYPDPEFFKFALNIWSEKNIKRWSDLFDTTTLAYNPIENYDRKEDYTTTENGTNESALTNQSTSKSGSAGERHGDSKSTSTASSTSFNSDALKVSGRNETTSATNENSMDNTTASNSTTGSQSGKFGTSSTTTARIHGNIGVTTTQQMIMSQRDVVSFNIYDVIIQDFKKEFCLMIY